ncbi:isochorismate pyruvate-lyase [Sphingobacterium sp. InxBP1]|uniref:isochorismate pyruvate-lyase n=1 Tax=Sphingobacterium sp. InxBP1 TaxID=2870328 RepID=UPI002243A8C2|nr:isochorismate pyruvate-lyase [Sphingobacterium sp. InxBP1]MCW8310347.1 isochorismate pyruvate-lyase [Sphingobacterium sp. InxBP1]
MIRPLEYCVNSQHIKSSIDTIDSRIAELLALRQMYLNKGRTFTGKECIEEDGIRNISNNYAVLARKFDLPTEFIQVIFDKIDNYFNQDYTTKGYEQQ